MKRPFAILQHVDLAIRRTDLDAAKVAMAGAGFIFHHVKGVDMFLDGTDAKARDAVHIVFAGETIRPEYALPVPDVSEAETTATFRLMDLEPLVRMKLTSFRIKDKMHLLDLIEVGLIDESWPGRFPPELAERLQELIENPEG